MINISSKYIGLITGTAMLMAALIMFYIVKIPAIGSGQYLVWTIYTAGIIWALMNHKTAPEQTFKAYFSEGFKTFIVAALIIIVYTFIFYKMNPQIVEKMIMDNDALIIKEGNHTPAEMQQNADKFRSIFIPGMLMTNTLIYLVIGALVSVIGAGFLADKKVKN